MRRRLRVSSTHRQKYVRVIKINRQNLGPKLTDVAATMHAEARALVKSGDAANVQKPLKLSEI